MRSFLVVSLLSLLAALPSMAEEPAAAASTIREVTVYSDRARVTRVAAVPLAAGSTALAFRGLPGWTDEGSVRVALMPPAAGRVTDVQVQRDYLARSGDEEVRKAEKAVQDIADRIAETDDALKVLEDKRAQVEAIRFFSLEKLPKDVAVRDVDPASYGKVVDFIASSLTLIATQRRDIEQSRRELQPELAAQQRKLNELQQLRQLEQRTVIVTVDAPAAAKAEVLLTYMLPGATWEPAHELRAQGQDPKTATINSYAVVTQTTGEDWDGAVLAFSTQSPIETIRIPELEALLLGGSPVSAPAAPSKVSSFSKAQVTYAAQNGLWYNANNPKEDLNSFLDNVTRQQDVQGRAATTFRKLQTRGTTAHFSGLSSPRVRSDGRSVRVPIAVVDLAAEGSVVAAPQVSLNAVRTLKMRNTGPQPLLPGALSIFHDGAFLGVTDVDFVAGGEEFAVFLGVADRIKLARVLDRKHSSLVRGRRTRMQVAFEVTVENLAAEAVTLGLTDRIPVSENKEVKISGVSVEPEVRPDSQGLLAWQLKLAPREKRTLRIAYAIEYPPELVQVERLRANAAPAAAAPVDAGESQVMQQIDDLEAAF
jgi:uncharacterized protein (TIGR02231 family)